MGGSILSDSTGCSDSLVNDGLKFEPVGWIDTPSFNRVRGEVDETFFDDLCLSRNGY